MPGLINAQRAPARQRKLDEQAPPRILDRTGRHVVFFHLLNERLYIIALEIEFMNVVLVGRMDGHLSRRQAENQSAVAHIDVGQLQDIPQESPVGFRIGTVDNCMGSVDHVKSSFSRFTKFRFVAQFFSRK